MDGNNKTTVCCCFCGQSLAYEKAVQLIATTEGMDDEKQTLFAHKKCLAECLHTSIILHPDFSD
jgi:hypothetical protein